MKCDINSHKATRLFQNQATELKIFNSHGDLGNLGNLGFLQGTHKAYLGEHLATDLHCFTNLQKAIETSGLFLLLLMQETH